MIGSMAAARGKVTMVLTMVAAILVLIASGVGYFKDRRIAPELRPAPAPRGRPGVTLGFLVQELSDGSLQVNTVQPGSPAEQGGVRTGDVLKGFAGFSVKRMEGLQGALSEVKAGTKTACIVIRDGREVELTVVPAARARP